MKFLVLLALAFPVCAAERILDFHSSIRIARDGALTVTERIEVQAEGSQIRRGILRDFPTGYSGALGAKARVPFRVIGVTRDGRSEHYAVERLANGERIRIGSADVMLSPGRHVYEITYRTSRQLGFFSDHDELYWNVNGNGWTFPFDRLSAEVRLPARVPAGDLRLAAYTGPQGSRGSSYEVFAREGGVAFRATRAFAPREGMTIVVGFPKGIVVQPSLAARAGWWVSANAGAVAALLGFALLFAFLYWRWWLVGVDPQPGPRFPRYEPPPGLGPGAVRYLDRMGFDNKCFAAALLDLGARGFLKIREHGGVYDIERTGKDVEWLPGEKPISDMLTAPGHPVTIGKEYSPGVQRTRELCERMLALHLGEQFFSRNLGSFITGAVIAVAFCVLGLVLEAPAAVLVVVAGAMALTLLLFWRLLPAYSVPGRKLQDEIDGLRQYLSVAEADTLRRMKAPPQTASEFARFLPYAVALGVEKTWAERFSATLGSAAVAAAVSYYYQSDSFSGGSSFTGFGDSLSDLSNTVASASTAPASSSGGGGGSSGGGGGGGGGSGW